ncbi:hypothetical protein M422DRAFT_784263 [Sphaerobolus stellatus SS14]|uniref:Uncharacterized protein n=1 Tax=Sphaerobolus stellatus (strain SS14) TaxID=990650 RepID=A0A0C9TIU1_SPHS4|nr:hypothetical protein M422DRAFT_784263 [Sphaerobolus stellatus SS14]
MPIVLFNDPKIASCIVMHALVDLFPPISPNFFQSHRPHPYPRPPGETLKGPHVAKREREGYIAQLKLAAILWLVSLSFNKITLPHFLCHVWFAHPFEIISFASIFATQPKLLEYVCCLRIDIAFKIYLEEERPVTIQDIAAYDYAGWVSWEDCRYEKVSFVRGEFETDYPDYRMRRLGNSAMRWFPNLVAFDGGYTGTGIHYCCAPLPGYLSGLIKSLASAYTCAHCAL